MKTIQETITRFAAWWSAVVERAKRRDLRFWLALISVAFIVETIAQNALFAGTTLLATHILHGIEWLMRKPIGFFGLILFAMVAVLLILTMWESRPRPIQTIPAPDEPDLPMPLPLTPEERALIQDYRTTWNRYGQPPVWRVYNLFHRVIHESRLYWVKPLLKSRVERLKEGIDAMDHAVADQSTASLREVQDGFNALYKAYLQALRWLAMLKNDVGKTPDYDSQMESWKDEHTQFFDKLRDMAEVPEHKKVLAVFRNFPEEITWRPYTELLNEAEARTRRMRPFDVPDERGTAGRAEGVGSIGEGSAMSSVTTDPPRDRA